MKSWEKVLNVIDVCDSEDRVYIYINARLFADQSSFPEADIFQMCSDFQPFTYYHHQMIENHWDDKDWSGPPDNFSDMTRFLIV